MLKIANKFGLDHRHQHDINGNDFILPVADGLSIVRFLNEGDKVLQIPIADILWSNKYDDCYIKTVKDNFQTHVVSYDDFKDFVMLIDEAYMMIHIIMEGVK